MIKKDFKKKFLFFILLFIFLIFTGCNASTSTETISEENEESKEVEEESTENDLKGVDESTGNELNIAVTAQPPIIDPHMTTATAALEIARNVFETLVALNEQYQPTNMLAETIDISDDGLEYTFHLREGVTFHNGKELTAEDVVASMNRWLEKSSDAQAYLSSAVFEEKDKYTVVMTVEEYSTDVLEILAARGQFPAIMPKEIIESAEAEGVTEIIGTGPFQYEEWEQDQYIHLSKYSDYKPVDDEPSGLSGRKEALVDHIYFHFVPDTSTRLAGIQTGEYDIADTMPYDYYEQLLEMPDLETHISFDAGTHNLYFNKKEGMMTDKKMRQAINAALDNDAIMLASYANEDLYDLHSSYMNPEQVNWASDAGSESYNQNDLEKAKKLLKEAGYDEEEITLLTSRDYDYHYNAAVVVKEQLEQLGMVINLEVYDWPTYQEQRDDPEKWDLITIGNGYVSTPSQLLPISSNWIGWADDPKIDDLLKKIRTAPSQEEAKAYWDELQGFLWNDYVPIVSFGHKSRIITTSNKVKGFEIFSGPIVWNVSIEE